MKTKYLFLVLAILLMVIPASAVTESFNATYDGSITRGDSLNETWTALRNGVGTFVFVNRPVYVTMGYTFSMSTFTNKYDRHSRGALTFNTSALTDAAIIDSVALTTYSYDKVDNLGTFNWSLVDFTPTNKSSYVAGDYNKTTFTRLANDIPYATFAARNASNVFTLTNLTYINKTSTTAFMLTDSADVGNLSLSWADGSENYFMIRPPAYASGAFCPQLNVTYHLSTGTTSTYPFIINNTYLLPKSDTNLPSIGYNVSPMNITPGQYGLASFAAKPSVGVTDIQVVAGDLISGGDMISKSNIDVKVVKPWFQPYSTYEDFVAEYITETTTMLPELLLNNDSMISNNYTYTNSSIWVSNATFSGYFGVGNNTIGGWQDDWKVYDNKTGSGDIQPFAMDANENRQFTVTVYAPVDQPSGNYTGKLWINSSSTTPVSMNVSVRILPFTLPNATMTHSISYLGVLPRNGLEPTNYGLTSEKKTETQYARELQDMKDHEVLYPTNAQGFYRESSAYAIPFRKTLQMRNQSGLPMDKIYVWNSLIDTPTATSPEDLSVLATRVEQLLNETNYYGFGDVYGEGLEEENNATFDTEIAALTTVRNGGAYTWFSTEHYQGINISTLTDTVVLANEFNTAYLNAWKAANPNITVLEYANPQAGCVIPETYRKNYGFALWVSGYDGAMDYAYQARFGQSIWNSYDHRPGLSGGHWIDDGFTRPITEGLVSSTMWEAYRQGVDDSRYADELTRRTGSRTAALAIINADLAAGVDMSVIRIHLQDAILALGDTTVPTASFTKNATTAVQPGSFLFNDTSSNTPTQWNWSFGDSNWSNGTMQNVTHTYPSVGTYTVFLVASNEAGSNQSASQTITATAPTTSPTPTPTPIPTPTTSAGISCPTASIGSGIAILGVALICFAAVLVLAAFSGVASTAGGRVGGGASSNLLLAGVAIFMIGAILVTLSLVIIYPLLSATGC